MAHTHDGIDWTARLAPMRRVDAAEADVTGWVAERLVATLPDGATVVDVGSGSGGMAAALGAALAARAGGRVVLVDAVPELLEAATARVRETVGDKVAVAAVHADAADGTLPSRIGDADLVWASGFVHHLPDQARGIADLVALLAPGGWLAVREGGLDADCLPWDIGLGEPGLGDRLRAARSAWFVEMRDGMAGAVRLPGGWNRVLAAAGLSDVTAFSYLVDLPAPTTPQVREVVADWLAWLAEVTRDRLLAQDSTTVTRLLDATGPDWIGLRDDVFILNASTVHLGGRTP